LVPRPQVAIVVVAYQSEGVLARCLAAVAAQTTPPARVIVVENRGPGGSAKRETAGLDVEWITLDVNVGFAAANNLGIRRAEGCEWVALLNPDAFPAPTWLEQLLAAARAHPDVAMFASQQLLDEDPSRLDGAGDEYSVAGLAWRRGHGRLVADGPRQTDEIFSPCAAAALYRRQVVLDAGGFDEAFFCYFEDVDLAFRLRLAGHRGLYVPAAVVRHVGGASTGPRSDFATYHGHRNMVWAFVKNMPGPLLALYWPAHVTLNLVAIGWLARRGQASVGVRAKLDALRDLRRVWRQRQTVQASRRVGAWAVRRKMVGGLRAFGVGRFTPESRPQRVRAREPRA
jgi:GT2 family glycosyltransferase